KLFGTGPAIIEAIEKDEIDLAYVGLPPAMIGIDRGVRVRCVAGGHVEGTVFASGKGATGYPEIKEHGEVLSQFNTIGVPGKGSIHDLILMDALESSGYSVKVINFGWSDEVLDAFVKGDIDAVVGTPALAQAVISFGGGRIIYPPNLLWPDNPSYGILVKDELLRDDRDLIKDFIIRHESASRLLREEREDVSRSIARLIGIVDERFVSDTLNISPRYCASLTDGYIDCTLRLKDRMKELGYIKGHILQEEIFDLSLIDEVHPGPDHYR
ncbi:MAG: ABC transporter substrate-binding protein, partial [Thermodesulfovibrionales bacterium]